MKKIFIWIITIAAFTIWFWIGSQFLESQAALKWPQTNGQMLYSNLFIHYVPNLLDINADSLRWYRADVKYLYSVGDRTYLSNRLSFEALGTRSPKPALKEMNKYRRQHEVTVYYDPTNPQQAVLEPANIGDLTIPLMIGILFVFMSLFFLYDESFKIQTQWGDGYLYRGIRYQKQAKIAEALIEFNKYIDMSPNLAQGYKCRGKLYLQYEQWDRAIADFNKAIRIDPTDADIYFNRAQAYLGGRIYYEAHVDIKKAMEMGVKVNPEILKQIQKGL